MNLIKRQILLPRKREVNILFPESICPAITATHDGTGHCFLISNGTGYALLTDIFALATSLEKNELIYCPLAFAYMDAYMRDFPDPEYLYKGIVIFNFNSIRIRVKDIIRTIMRTR